MGVKKIFRPEETFWDRLYLPEIARGLGITFRHLWRSLVHPESMPTHQYPEQRRPVADRFRGRHRLRMRPDGSPKCVACYCCETICPTHAIRIEAQESENPDIEKRPRAFQIDMLRCIYCGMCVEACPKDAIYMTPDYELADKTRERLRYGLDRLLDPEPAEGEG